MTNFSNVQVARLSRLGLNDDPFLLSSNPRYLYLGVEHLSVYNNVLGVIERRRGLALVTGNPGTGKSSLARHIFDKLFGQDGVAIAYIATTDFDSRILAAKKISQAFGSSLDVPSSKSYHGQMDNLMTSILKAYQQGQNVIILLDDAQLLRRQGMVMLHELYNYDYAEKAVTTIAFGQDETKDIFKSYPALASRLYTVQSLDKISYTTALQMMGFRLQVAGRTQPLFNNDAFDYLFTLSDGIPREVVLLCSMAIDYIIQNDGNMITLNVMEQVGKEYEQISRVKPHA